MKRIAGLVFVLALFGVHGASAEIINIHQCYGGDWEDGPNGGSCHCHGGYVSINHGANCELGSNDGLPGDEPPPNTPPDGTPGGGGGGAGGDDDDSCECPPPTTTTPTGGGTTVDNPGGGMTLVAPDDPFADLLATGGDSTETDGSDDAVMHGGVVLSGGKPRCSDAKCKDKEKKEKARKKRKACDKCSKEDDDRTRDLDNEYGRCRSEAQTEATDQCRRGILPDGHQVGDWQRAQACFDDPHHTGRCEPAIEEWTQTTANELGSDLGLTTPNYVHSSDWNACSDAYTAGSDGFAAHYHISPNVKWTTAQGITVDASLGSVDGNIAWAPREGTLAKCTKVRDVRRKRRDKERQGCKDKVNHDYPDGAACTF